MDEKWCRVYLFFNQKINYYPNRAPGVADTFGSNHRSLFLYFSDLLVYSRFCDVTTPCRSLLRFVIDVC